MDVNYFAFRIETSGATDNLSLIEHIEANPPQWSSKKTIPKRIINIDSNSDQDFVLGLVVTVRDQKSYVTLKDRTFRKEDLTGRPITEVNYFVIHKKSGAGLYQSYHGSCTLNSFFALFRRSAREISTKLYDAEMEAANKAISTDISESKRRKQISKKRKEAQDKTKINVDCVQIVDKNNLAQMIQHFARIKSFDYVYGTIDTKVEESVPGGQYVMRKRAKVSYQPATPIGPLAKLIERYILENRVDKGFVTVENADGEEEKIRIHDQLTNYGRITHDEFVDKLVGEELEDLAHNPIIGELLSVVNSSEHRLKFSSGNL